MLGRQAGQLDDVERALVALDLEGRLHLRADLGEALGLERLALGLVAPQEPADGDAGDQDDGQDAGRDGPPDRSPEAALGARLGLLGPALRLEVGLDLAHQRALEAGGRGPGLDRGGQKVDGRVEPQEVLAALVAAGEVALDLELLGRLESAQRVGGELVPIFAMVAHGSASEASRMPIPSARSRRTFSRPSRIRPLTVPRGMLSISAISEWVKPPK